MRNLRPIVGLIFGALILASILAGLVLLLSWGISNNDKSAFQVFASAAIACVGLALAMIVLSKVLKISVLSTEASLFVWAAGVFTLLLPIGLVFGGTSGAGLPYHVP
jgi:hypothetical protein